MADIAALGISIKADGAQAAARDLDRVSGAAKRAEQATRGIVGASTEASDRLRRLGQATATLDGPLGGVASRFRSLGMLIRSTSVATAAFTLALGGIALAVSRFGQVAADMADQWSDMNARVGLAIGNMDGSAAIMDRLSDVAMRTYSSLELSAESFIRNSTVLKELGKATSEQLDFTESLNLAFVVSGAKAQRAAQLQEALGRAMASGALRGLELNTVIENGGRVAEVLAEELGVGTNQLRALGAQGKITSEVIYNALTKRLEQLREEAELMPATIGDGFLLLRNSFLTLVGTFDQQYKISQSLAEALVGLSQNLDTVAKSAVVAGSALLAAFSGSILAGIRAVTFAIGVGLVNSVRVLTVAMMSNPLSALAGAIAIAVTWITQFGEETYKVGNTTIHVGNTMKAVWTTIVESISMAITAAVGLGKVLVNIATFNWSGASDAAKAAAQDIADSASRVAESWREITSIPGTDRFAFAGNMALHLSPVPAPRPQEEWEPNEFEKEVARIRKRAESLANEAKVVGLATYESEKYLTMQRLIAAAHEAGLKINDELLRQIDEEASALARRTAAYEEAVEAQRRLDDLRDTFQSSMSGFARDIARGTNALDSLASALQRVADKLIDMAVNNLFENAFGKQGTSNSFFGNLANGSGSGGLFGGMLIPGVLHNGGIAGNDNYPHRAVPLAAFANAQRYHSGGIAGLKPNEVPAILERGELVIPKNRVQGQSGSGVVINMPVTIDATGADAAGLARVERAVADLNATLPARVVQVIRESRDRGVA